MKTRVHVFVGGEVQGVFFRQEMSLLAANLNITGWVRNRYDGRVEAVFEGEAKGIQTMVEFCKRGPSDAVVTDVEIKPERYSGEFTTFKVMYD